MARTNKKPVYERPVTHEGAPAAMHVSAGNELRRSVMACLLWEDQFYESGESIAERVNKLAARVDDPTLAAIAIEAREKMHLRHMPLLLAGILCRPARKVPLPGEPNIESNAVWTQSMVGDTVARVIKRADELAELPAIYLKACGFKRADLAKRMPAQMKKGLAKAFRKFDAYGLAKYNRDSEIKLRDVLFLCHAKPKDAEQEALWKSLVDGSIKSPDTWEVALSGGADKKEAFTRLLNERKLGYLALLRNLRNMMAAGVDDALVKAAITAREGGANRVLPFRYIAAARACPQMEPALDIALRGAIADMPALRGKTIVLVDISGSMNANLSAKSDMKRMDAAAALASIINGEDVRVFSFSNNTVEVPYRAGMAGVDAILRSQMHGGTDLGAAVEKANKIKHDRMIVVTDEQSHTVVPDPVAEHAYMVNVASYQNGVGYGKWTHIDGWSEHVIRYIYAAENAGVIDGEDGEQIAN